MIRRMAVVLALGLCLVPFTACYDPRARIPFQAHFTLEGSPLAEVGVYLIPKDGNGPAPINGITDSQGYVQLGAMAGEYHVCVQKGDVMPEVIMDPFEAKRRGMEFKAGGVSAATGKGGKGGATPGMDQKKVGGGAKGPMGPGAGKGPPGAPGKGASQNGIPLIYKDPNTTPLSVTVPTQGTVEFDLKKGL